MAGRCLIVANQTLGGPALEGAVRDCITRGITRFHVLVPKTRIEDETSGWTGGFRLADETWTSPQALERVEEQARRSEANLEDAEVRARDRLRRMVEKVESMGGEADGEVGTDDPYEATRALLEHRTDFEEIVVSTLPAGISRWLKLDLPNRIGRITDVPVTTIEASADE